MAINVGPISISLKPRPRQKATLGDIQSSRNIVARFGEGPEYAKTVYGEYMATSVPAYRAVKLRADAIASAPLYVYQQSGEIAQRVPAEHPMQMLLDRVNNWWTRADLWKATEIYLSLWGSAFWFIEKEGNVPVAIWPIRPDHMSVVPDPRPGPNKYILGYFYEQNRRVPLSVDEVVWFRYFHPMTEYAGLSPLAAARRTMDMGREALKFNERFFANGALPADLIFPVNGPVSEEEAEDFYKRLEKRHKGADKAHRPMLWDLSQGGKPERLGITHKDMEFIAMLNYTVEDAARVWGVPPPKMYSQSQSIYNNVKQADIEFYTDTISSEWRFLEAEVNELLLPILGYQDLFVAFDTSNILPLQEAMAEQHARQREDVNMGILTINEVRQSRNLEPVTWGDAWWQPFTVVEVGEGGELAEEFGRLPKPRTPTKGFEISVAHAFDKRLTAAENRFLLMQRELFAAQKKEILKRLLQRKSLKQVGDEIFDQEHWVQIFMARGRPVVRTALVLSAQAQANEFNLGPFNPDLERVANWLTERTRFWADKVNLDTAQLLMAELAEGNQLGEGIPQLADRIEKVFKFNDKVRAERIARTESLAASNQGHLEIYEQSGVVEEKIWLATLDERVRPAHAASHRQIVPLHEPFIVDGEELEAPGIGGSAGNVINCRCTTAPIIRARSLNGRRMAALSSRAG